MALLIDKPNGLNLGSLFGQGFNQGFLPAFQQGLQQANEEQQRLKKIDQLTSAFDQIAPGQGKVLATLAQQDPKLAQSFIQQLQDRKFAEGLLGGNQNPTTASALQQPQLNGVTNENVPQQVGAKNQIGNQPQQQEAPYVNPYSPTKNLTAEERQLLPSLNRTEQVKLIKDANNRAVQDKREEAKQSKEDEKYARAQTQEFVDDVISKEKVAKEEGNTLARMRKIITNGKLSNPLITSLVDTLAQGIGTAGGFKIPGINFKSLLTGDTQELLKLSQSYVRNVKQIFGSRISNFEVESYLNTIPNATQDPEAALRLIDGMEILNQAALLRGNTLRQIIKENGGKRPLDIEQQLQDRIGEDLDLLAEQYKELPLSPEPRTKYTKDILATEQRVKAAINPRLANPGIFASGV